MAGKLGAGAAAGAAAGVPGIAVGAGAGLLGDLLENWWDFEQQKQKDIATAQNQGFENAKAASNTLAKGQQDALGALLASYGKSLL